MNPETECIERALKIEPPKHITWCSNRFSMCRYTSRMRPYKGFRVGGAPKQDRACNWRWQLANEEELKVVHII